MPSNRPNVAPEVKRQEIRSAARSLFFSEGFDRTSVARIARAAGVTPNTLYWYYPGKEQIFAAVVEELTALFFMGLNNRDPQEPVSETLAWVVEAMQAAQPLIVTLHEKARTSRAIAAVHDRFHDEVETLIGSRLRARGMDEARIPAIIHIVSFTVEGLLMHELAPAQRQAVIDEMAAQLFG